MTMAATISTTMIILIFLLCDGLDVGTAVTGGLTYREGNYICEALFQSNRLQSMELVEVDPSQHAGVEHSKTIDVALTLIGSAMGKTII